LVAAATKEFGKTARFDRPFVLAARPAVTGRIDGFRNGNVHRARGRPHGGNFGGSSRTGGGRGRPDLAGVPPFANGRPQGGLVGTATTTATDAATKRQDGTDLFDGRRFRGNTASAFGGRGGSGSTAIARPAAAETARYCHFFGGQRGSCWPGRCTARLAFFFLLILFPVLFVAFSGLACATTRPITILVHDNERRGRRPRRGTRPAGGTAGDPAGQTTTDEQCHDQEKYSHGGKHVGDVAHEFPANVAIAPGAQIKSTGDRRRVSAFDPVRVGTVLGVLAETARFAKGEQVDRVHFGKVVIAIIVKGLRRLRTVVDLCTFHTLQLSVKGGQRVDGFHVVLAVTKGSRVTVRDELFLVRTAGTDAGVGLVVVQGILVVQVVIVGCYCAVVEVNVGGCFVNRALAVPVVAPQSQRPGETFGTKCGKETVNVRVFGTTSVGRTL
jgi:hypothetical protein